MPTNKKNNSKERKETLEASSNKVETVELTDKEFRITKISYIDGRGQLPRPLRNIKLAIYSCDTAFTGVPETR